MRLQLIEPRELMDSGLLQEINRQFLHPRGLSLALGCDVDEMGAGRVTLLGVIDGREDPEGWTMDDPPSPEKAALAKQLWDERSAARREKLGWIVQPIGVAGPPGTAQIESSPA